MSKAALRGLALALPLMLGVSSGQAQWYTPQSDRQLRLSWTAERIGPSRVLITGDIENLSGQPASRVILRADGLDERGKVVSRSRGQVGQEVPAHGTSPFEIRLVPSGSERRYRVTVESFEFPEPARGRTESP
ncbi:MAG: hypothetical protein HY725_15685 [Candidatus Rokubacteria bacterium]|nr:hypothetical protein [Candidatus Rokubacteria bacterium]